MRLTVLRRLARHGQVRLLAVLLCLAACGGATAAPVEQPLNVEPLPQLTSMTVVLASPSIDAGQSTSASVVPIDHRGRAMTVGDIAWTSSQPTVATIGADGVLTALAPGTSIVQARVGMVQGQSTLVVRPPPPGPAPVASVTLNAVSVQLDAGASEQLSATVKDYAGNNLVDRSITWSTSQPDVAIVSPTGLVTALTPGTTVIDALAESRRSAMVVSVVAAVDTEITVTVMTPYPNQIIGDTMTVLASVQSLFPVTGVTANFGGLLVPMTYGPIGGAAKLSPAMGWSTKLNVSTLVFGPYALVVTATDSRNHKGVLAMPIVRNPTISGGSKAPTANK